MITDIILKKLKYNNIFFIFVEKMEIEMNDKSAEILTIGSLLLCPHAYPIIGRLYGTRCLTNYVKKSIENKTLLFDCKKTNFFMISICIFGLTYIPQNDSNMYFPNILKLYVIKHIIDKMNKQKMVILQ